ncbi:hypothetical protein TYRP_015620 [Tyrophagus putrescentiae]|nr:hypothetical protein TYRP_015620 [Tyrophagus putrescentiae]
MSINSCMLDSEAREKESTVCGGVEEASSLDDDLRLKKRPGEDQQTLLLLRQYVIDVVGGVLAAQALVLRFAPAVQQVAADEGARHVGHILPRPAGDDVEEGVDGVRADLLLKGRQLNADDVADEGELAEVLVAAHGGRFLVAVVVVVVAFCLAVTISRMFFSDSASFVSCSFSRRSPSAMAVASLAASTSRGRRTKIRPWDSQVLVRSGSASVASDWLVMLARIVLRFVASCWPSISRTFSRVATTCRESSWKAFFSSMSTAMFIYG